MKGLSQQVLARTGIALEEKGNVRVHNQPGARQHAAEVCILGDDVREFRFALELIAQPPHIAE